MWYDVLVAGVLLFAVIRGSIKGFVWQLATIAALVLCFAFSGSLSQDLAPYITLQPPLNRWVAMFGLYIIFSFLSFGVARVLKGWIDKAQFTEYDRHLGSMFGLIKGAIFVLVMTFFSFTLTHHAPEARAAIFNSQTGKIAAVIMDRLHPVMPNELHAVLEPYIHTLDRPDLKLKYSHEAPATPGGAFSPAGISPPQPLQAPPFPASPRRIQNDPPPFDSVTGRETAPPPSHPSSSEYFNPSYPQPNSQPSLPENNPFLPPANGTQPNRNNLRTEQVKLLNEVAGVLAEKPEARQAIVTEIENSLVGLPDEIQLGVVKDWYSDLLVFDRSTDPDPETDSSTPFDVRIVRQLERSNVPLSSLNTALKDRLEKTRQ